MIPTGRDCGLAEKKSTIMWKECPRPVWLRTRPSGSLMTSVSFRFWLKENLFFHFPFFPSCCCVNILHLILAPAYELSSIFDGKKHSTISPYQKLTKNWKIVTRNYENQPLFFRRLVPDMIFNVIIPKTLKGCEFQFNSWKSLYVEGKKVHIFVW